MVNNNSVDPAKDEFPEVAYVIKSMRYFLRHKTAALVELHKRGLMSEGTIDLIFDDIARVNRSCKKDLLKKVRS